MQFPRKQSFNKHAGVPMNSGALGQNRIGANTWLTTVTLNTLFVTCSKRMATDPDNHAPVFCARHHLRSLTSWLIYRA
jgi:hypothetical protein